MKIFIKFFLRKSWNPIRFCGFWTARKKNFQVEKFVCLISLKIFIRETPQTTESHKRKEQLIWLQFLKKPQSWNFKNCSVSQGFQHKIHMNVSYTQPQNYIVERLIFPTSRTKNNNNNIKVYTIKPKILWNLKVPLYTINFCFPHNNNFLIFWFPSREKEKFHKIKVNIIVL